MKPSHILPAIPLVIILLAFMWIGTHLPHKVVEFGISGACFGLQSIMLTWYDTNNKPLFPTWWPLPAAIIFLLQFVNL